MGLSSWRDSPKEIGNGVAVKDTSCGGYGDPGVLGSGVAPSTITLVPLGCTEEIQEGQATTLTQHLPKESIIRTLVNLVGVFSGSEGPVFNANSSEAEAWRIADVKRSKWKKAARSKRVASPKRPNSFSRSVL
ncbi:hypothetical protein PanWU01x14_140860 [Parasponia andersonii]|uniref:Uncharacterized protein n=1 Tax=Parasponia andersonii TaxID=3476 RepID=A0A2P5CM44_PARAD|nr:hypothetical protein PanWU01x14_140860 [Parasponia andersonii]